MEQQVKSLMSKFNHATNLFGIDTKDYNYEKMSDAYNDQNFKDHTFNVYGLFINKGGKFQPHPVAIVDIENKIAVDLPSHLTDDIQQMLDNEEIVQYIKQGHCGFKINTYFSNTWKKEFYGVEWLDI